MGAPSVRHPAPVDADEPMGDPPVQRSDRVVLVATIVGVPLYVVTWFVVGLATPGHDHLVDAISELFAVGAPDVQRWTLTAVLVVTGVVLLPLGFVLDRVLPGTGRLGVWLTTAAGVGTVAAAAFPCTAGCPGVGTTTTDTLHVVAAGGGYVGLVTAPLAWAWRLRGTDEGRLAVLGVVLGGLATVGFVTRNLLGVDAFGGLQQRVFNTAADAWFVVAAVRGLVRQADGTDVSRRPPRRDAAR